MELKNKLPVTLGRTNNRKNEKIFFCSDESGDAKFEVSWSLKKITGNPGPGPGRAGTPWPRTWQPALGVARIRNFPFHGFFNTGPREQFCVPGEQFCVPGE